MKIYVKTLCGATLTLNVSERDTLNYVRLLIRDTEGVPPSIIRLKFAGRFLDDSTQTLLQENILKDSNRAHVQAPAQLLK